MAKCIVVHRQDKNNVGDIASNPLQYFLKPDEYDIVDVTDIGRLQFDESIPIIAGGGGLIGNSFMDDILRDLTGTHDRNQLLSLASEYWQISSTSNKQTRDEFFKKLNTLVKEYSDKLSVERSPRIIWGAGHNGEYQKKMKGRITYPKWLREFDLVGIRDNGQEFQWVPCASCMHPALRKEYVIKNDVIWFEHKKQLIKSTDFGADPIPRFINSGDNIEQTIELLGSANTVITNSYHGAYWATLMKKKVFVVEPWSSKFNAMRHTPTFLGKGDFWKDHIDSARIYNSALDESIAATENYWAKVKQYVS
jgi:hypothetical protein|tara:strand:+ start:824 stop:1747 length:924 start_codon:yes stop_codon:yes gene_type:complete